MITAASNITSSSAPAMVSKNRTLMAYLSRLQSDGHQNHRCENQSRNGRDARKSQCHHISSPFFPGFKITPMVSAARAAKIITAATIFLAIFIGLHLHLPSARFHPGKFPRRRPPLPEAVSTVLCVLVQLR